MEIIKLYHGSDHIIREPKYLGGRPDNDYGNGFYTTEYEDRARIWAALNGNPEKSIVNVYEIDMSQLKILDLNQCGVLAWIGEVIYNRGVAQEAATIVGKRLTQMYKQDTEAFDVIKGYRADDSYTQVIEAFLLNQLNIAEVERLFYKGDLGNQIFLKSPKAFEKIQWKSSYEVHSEDANRDYDIQARREVNRFLQSRMEAILLDGFVVPGITARYAIQNKLIYHQEGNYYDTDSL